MTTPGEAPARLDGRYWRLWWANAVNSVGDGAFVAAIPLLAVTVTTDPREISYLGAATYLPWLLMSLPAGVLIDRYDRATLMWRCQAAQAVVVAGLAVAANAGRVSLVLLLVASFLLGCAQVVIANAAQSALPQYVPASLLPKANGTQYVAQTLGQLALGPPLGSLLFVIAAVLPFGLDAVSFVVSAVLLATLPRVHGHIRPGSAQRRSVLIEIAEGLRWLRRHRLLRTLAVVLGMNTFCHQMAIATLVLFATRTLRLSERDFGLLLVGAGLGGVLGGLLNSRVTERLGVLPTLLAAYTMIALSYVGMALAPTGLVLAGLLTAAGLAVTLTNVVTVSLRQQLVPDQLLGRVNSVYRMLSWGLMPLGSLAGGITAEHFGLRSPLLGAGAIRFAMLVATLPILITEVRGRSAAGWHSA